MTVVFLLTVIKFYEYCNQPTKTSHTHIVVFEWLFFRVHKLCVCVCVCVCMVDSIAMWYSDILQSSTSLKNHYSLIYDCRGGNMCRNVCVCVCVRERERV